MKKVVVIVLLIVALALACVGIVSVAFYRMSGFARNNPFDRQNIPSVLEESKTLKVDAGKPVTLNVNSAAGDVTITGGDVETVQVRAVKTAYDSTQSRADEEVKTIKYTIEQNGNSITIKYELPKSMNFSNNVNTVDFIVTVPAKSSVTVDTGFGEVSATNLEGDTDLANDFGDVTAQNIEGALIVSTNSGTVEAVSITAEDGDIRLSSDFGNISLEKAVAKNITLESNSGEVTITDTNATDAISTKSDYGTTRFENGSAASINVETNSGKVELTKFKVDDLVKVDDDFGDITLTQTSASAYDLHTSSGTITVDGAKGSLKAYTDFGNIEVMNAQSVTLDLKTNSGSVEFTGSLGDGPHQVKSDFGNITLVLPPDTKLDVELKTDFGNIESDLPITVTLTGSSENDKNEITGTINGGGEQLTVQTNSGNINIKSMK
jgi:DUF4097 and DUF4098 domain-containing protein YvlB